MKTIQLHFIIFKRRNTFSRSTTSSFSSKKRTATVYFISCTAVKKLWYGGSNFKTNNTCVNTESFKIYTCIIIFLVIDMFKLYNSKVTVSTHFIKTIQNKQIHVSEEVLNSIEARIHSNVPSLYPEEIGLSENSTFNS